MRFLILIILFSFPLTEGTLLFHLYQANGAWLIAWVALAALTGFVLLKEARFTLASRLGHGESSNAGFSLGAFITSGRTVLAGLLLIFPGVISDLIAFGLLLLPSRSMDLELVRNNSTTRRSRASQSGARGVVLPLTPERD
jgi:UPF0716 protein FxsA